MSITVGFFSTKTESLFFINFENATQRFELFGILKMSKYLENNKNNKTLNNLRMNCEQIMLLNLRVLLEITI